MTPAPSSHARPPVESLINEVVCKEHVIAGYVRDPDGGLADFRRAVTLGLQRIQDQTVTTSWTSATTSARSGAWHVGCYAPSELRVVPRGQQNGHAFAGRVIARQRRELLSHLGPQVLT